MDIKQIQELVKLVNKTNIGEITIEENGTKITIKQKKDPNQTIYTQAAVSAPVAPVAAIAAPPSTAPKEKAPATSGPEPKADNLITIKSPMIGTFYRQAGPGKPLFVNVGDEVAPGKVVCIIEAMKLFNEIESEVSGKIVKILVDNASPVEYDQPLFLVEPV
ncbi:MAG TPA: acetyl-CoA carboxylase biotin carboxyl carrier protein [Ferruginibacter sp.]|jgi:acetyl-CoA carboxylase biotin carboxyl carrier protein|nr:acetyl-CoA carboxylase biotin carboxyl carrier protein [Bacteroidota bacterium]MBS1925987.1 acetyl-CoA carboxylase biotin carboxyl carrier protein [Bacteroidota bacterium]MCC6692042.1 acetyl-CoA carboxylase biotin carboxyl carrier protein [Chitinophagaceae bacterium]HMT96892.1 acetyl-CoA carboxylase biotin carboxyl carrier protein [Ferruginibacter sp.]HMU24454.1 acetyl-CoA carboxylase biotin carboxyl carrier protein [Ferruginibacter sp.]